MFPGRRAAFGAKLNHARAFTLIELLVVCAIIAILAAIAMPNYQDALARSKVARIRGDCNAVQTAIESYVIDFNVYAFAERYPVDSPCDSSGNQTPGGPFEGYLPRTLTTPVGYLNKLPDDPFVNQEDVGNCFPERRTYMYSSDSQNLQVFSQYFISILYAQLDGQVTFTSYRPSPAVWMISSPGPDADRDTGVNMTAASGSTPPARYDPTNGTVADGDVFMFGPGLGF